MKKTTTIVQAAMIAAIYVVLTMAVSTLNLASGAIQVRVSEALTVLPYFTAAAVPGLTIGCLIANLLTGAAPYDVVFGTLATLLGAVGTLLISRYRLPERHQDKRDQSERRQNQKRQFLCTLPPVLSNMLIIPFVLRYGYGLTMEFDGIDYSIPFYMLTVGAGEVICCCVLGSILLSALQKVRGAVFQMGS